MSHQITEIIASYLSLTDYEKRIISSAILADGAESAPRSTPTPGRATETRKWLPRLPELGADAALLDDPKAFNQPWYLRYEGIFDNFKVYFAGCAGLRSQSYQIDKGTHKIGTTHESNTAKRINKLSLSRYASMYNIEGHWTEEHKFDTWKGQQLIIHSKPKVNSPVLPTQWALMVKLPIGLSKETFDSALNHELRLCTLQSYVDSPEGRTVLGVRGLRRERFVRATPPKNVDDEPKFCRELFCLSPKYQADLVVEAVERLILRHALDQARQEGIAVG